MRGRRVVGVISAGVAGYLVGTTPSADAVTRVAAGRTADIRGMGSGNPGAANVTSSIGPAWGLAVMVADIAKGVVAGRIGRRLAGDLGVHVGSTAAVVGHCWPVWNGFKGGKGVATSVGQVLVSLPIYFPLDAAVAVCTAAVPGLERRAQSTTMVAAGTWVVASSVWAWRRWPNAWGPDPSPAMPLAAAVSSCVIADRFRRAAR